MSKNVARIVLTSPISSAVDASSGRYALGCVEILPQPKGKVLAVATNGRVGAVVELDGETDRPRLVPAQAMPTAKKHLPKRGYPVVSLHDDEWHGPHINNVPQYEGGRFPKLADCMPSLPSPADTLVVSFDAAELLKLAEALRQQKEDAGSSCPSGGSLPVVTLLIDKSRKEQDSAIAVVGDQGAGVLMPCYRETRAISQDAYVAVKRKLYEDLQSRLQKAEAKHAAKGGGMQHYQDEKPKVEPQPAAAE